MDSKPRIVIGVMPQNFRFLNSKADLILPMQFDRNKVFLGNFSYQGIARLKPGVTLQQANADVARMLPGWIRTWPPPPGFSRDLFENARFAPKVQPLKQEVVGDIGATLWVLMGTIGLVLLIACANVANLLLVRAESRQQELAIRAALGAGWGRIARRDAARKPDAGRVGRCVGTGAGVRGAASAGRQRSGHAAAAGGNWHRSARSGLHVVGIAIRRPAVRSDPGSEIRGTAPVRVACAAADAP